jgi:hypothetical protein
MKFYSNSSSNSSKNIETHQTTEKLTKQQRNSPNNRETHQTTEKLTKNQKTHHKNREIHHRPEKITTKLHKVYKNIIEIHLTCNKLTTKLNNLTFQPPSLQVQNPTISSTSHPTTKFFSPQKKVVKNNLAYIIVRSE